MPFYPPKVWCLTPIFIEDSIDEFISRRFEDIAAQYFSRRIKQGLLKDVYDVGSYWYDNPTTRTNGEFDVVLKRKSGYDIYECKYYTHLMNRKECDREISQIDSIKGIECNKVGFIALSGFDFKTEELELIDGEDLFMTRS